MRVRPAYQNTGSKGGHTGPPLQDKIFESGIPGFSRLGLKQGGSRRDSFCTPKGAKVISWEGVDGIHYCFVKGFGEVVLAVNPSNLPGEYVHPLARSLEDFLRLLLACNGLAAAEQARLRDWEKFDAFLREDGPPSPERRAALDGLRDLEPVFTTVERRLAGLFPAILRRFPLQSVRIAAENLLV